MSIKEETNANAKLGADKARDLIKGASKVIVMRGKKVTTFDLKKDMFSLLDTPILGMPIGL